MNTKELFTKNSRGAWIVFFACILISLAAFVTASQVQRDFGRVEVSNVTYPNSNGIPIRAKLLKPVGVSAESPAPGVVYIHGYQNNRETSDAYCIEMARRGFVVLEIDAIGRGNSGIPGDVEDPDFDLTYGGRSSFAYLKSLPYVDRDSLGLMGHSLGAEMVYTIALEDPSVQALVISGFAYTDEATESMPKNMLMIFGKYDEYRERMTGTHDLESEWMSSPQTEAAFGRIDADFGAAYGDFDSGTARKVVLLRGIHLQESHSRKGVAEAVAWMRDGFESGRILLGRARKPDLGDQRVGHAGRHAGRAGRAAAPGPDPAADETLQLAAGEHLGIRLHPARVLQIRPHQRPADVALPAAHLCPVWRA